MFLIFLLIVEIFSSPLTSNHIEQEESIDLTDLAKEIYGKPSENSGKNLEKWNETHPVNPEELGEYFEGDILIPKSLGRNGLVASSSLWPNGEVPYEISGPYTAKDMELINKAIGIYHKYTCIKFRARKSSDRDYIAIVSGPTGCWSSVGRITGRQELNLQSPYCTVKVGTILHELMHALGFFHEQNRWERDDYVNIAWSNIKKGHEANFNKAAKDTTFGYGVPYDYRSVMHYSKMAFSTNGRPTIVPLEEKASDKMGQREGFSHGDLVKLNTRYGCPELTPGGHPAPSNHGSSEEKESKGEGGILSFLLNLFTR